MTIEERKIIDNFTKNAQNLPIKEYLNLPLSKKEAFVLRRFLLFVREKLDDNKGVKV